ncbi:MAG: 4Fe-4S ferredoxin [Candidatus Eisenbacteria bacterium]|uniref:Electron transfer flavoprotein-ubiquinone oxidoreductase n=1 Tax=Eiseniibacteriota bacterium TaxID=2212470 RepID=A0A956LX12_UNCEI|nr:4Fe-4S ferredoxin [Candidatus Eisenbacteria bacterium]
MDVDIACVGFGPATGGFLTTLSQALEERATEPAFQSRVAPGLPLQVVCFERADDLGFGVSGVVTRARGIRASFPEFDPTEIPMGTKVASERLVYLQDPVGASRRSPGIRALDRLSGVANNGDHAVEVSAIPDFLRKDDGVLLSIGQFNQWVAGRLMSTGLVQLWPGMPVSQPLIEDDRVVGIRLVDQGTDRTGSPESGYMPGMDVHAGLVVVGDGPAGAVGQRLDERFGLPEGKHQRDWAVGMKMVVDLPEDTALEPGTVLHTIGYPEPEIFGFLYVQPERVASLGIFVPSWFASPVRTGYRYLQHWMMHPYLWSRLQGSRMRSWGAKTLQESGLRGEPHLVGDGYARIGEGSGSTNVLTGSGVDEAWTTGVLLAEAVIEHLERDVPFTRDALTNSYVARRRSSWLQTEAKVAEKARDGFQRGVLTGLVGMGLSGITGGRINVSGSHPHPRDRMPSVEEYYEGRIPAEEIASIRESCQRSRASLHDVLMERAGWPPIPHDGKLLVSHQDALLMGGKVQAPPGYPDHVVFLYPHLCESCEVQLCVEVCSGQAITPGEGGGVPDFDREKCVHCGACVWSCTRSREDESERGNIEFRAGAGGLHSAEN